MRRERSFAVLEVLEQRQTISDSLFAVFGAASFSRLFDSDPLLPSSVPLESGSSSAITPTRDAGSGIGFTVPAIDSTSSVAVGSADTDYTQTESVLARMDVPHEDSPSTSTPVLREQFSPVVLDVVEPADSESDADLGTRRSALSGGGGVAFDVGAGPSTTTPRPQVEPEVAPITASASGSPPPPTLLPDNGEPSESADSRHGGDTSGRWSPVGESTDGGADGAATAGADSTTSSLLASAGADAAITPGGCSGRGAPALEGQGQPPFPPPGCSSSSVADPLFVVDWNDGLVLFANVKEYEFPTRPVDLRAQVYGATVQSYSWDVSGAPDAENVTGSSTYRLQFNWASSPSFGGASYKTETVSITATMTDQSQQSMTLTFRLLNASGGVGAATWPAVLPPDKPLESQDVIASDSSTRPYGVSLGSGVLYTTHSIPAYQPVSSS